MIKTEAVNTAQQSDAELVASSLAGNHDAFRLVVERYQTLICSLAYCATGSVTKSEDLAQETFVAAWKDLAQLREPAKLRSWLCSIVRFRIGNQIRRQGREGVHTAEQVKAMDALVSPEAPPSAQAITNEETAILWRSLEQVPEIYREPLVLFYREHQSIETVAVNLDLTEDAVKQRLSRGRKMLQEQVLALIEGALSRTNPGQAFTLGVMAALPITLATSAKAASIGTAAAKGGALVKGATIFSMLGVVLGPAIGLAGGYFGLRTSLKNAHANAHTQRQRAATIRYGREFAAASAIFTVSVLLLGFLSGILWKHHPALLIVLWLATTFAWAIFSFVSARRFRRAYTGILDEERQLHPELFRAGPLPLSVWEYRSRATLLGLPLVHFRGGQARGQKAQPAIGWIALGEVAYGILLAGGSVAVGGISFGGWSVGIISFGGFALGLLAFGGYAVGGIALGGTAIGMIACGAIALGWHAALGGMAAARELAIGGAALANHVNDPVAREFFARHRWLDLSQAGPRNLVCTVCFAPLVLQMLFWKWWRRRMLKHAMRNGR
jgi:RNA polymerase sigma factor (sigma-70 family)